LSSSLRGHISKIYAGTQHNFNPLSAGKYSR
jgi:hypothetical protein